MEGQDRAATPDTVRPGATYTFRLGQWALTARGNPYQRGDQAARMGPRPFRVGSKKAVDVLTDRLRAGGCRVLTEPRTSGAGHYVSVVLDPEGTQVELLA